MIALRTAALFILMAFLTSPALAQTTNTGSNVIVLGSNSTGYNLYICQTMCVLRLVNGRYIVEDINGGTVTKTFILVWRNQVQ